MIIDGPYLNVKLMNDDDKSVKGRLLNIGYLELVGLGMLFVYNECILTHVLMS